MLAKITGKTIRKPCWASLRQRWVPSAGPTVTGLWLALDRPRDPGNLGTILRTADAVATDGVDPDRRGDRPVRAGMRAGELRQHRQVPLVPLH